MENDRETTLKIVIRKDFSEEAVFAQEPEWVWELVIWIHGQCSNRRTSRGHGRHFLGLFKVMHGGRVAGEQWGKKARVRGNVEEAARRKIV